MRAEVGETVRQVIRAAVDPTIAPIIDLQADPDIIGRLMFSSAEILFPSSPTPTVGDPAANSEGAP